MMRRLAGCIITDSHGKILLIHRNTPRLSQWELPGGKVEDGESPEATARREVLEEVNLRVSGLEELGTTEFDDNGFRWHYTWFLPAKINGEAKLMEATFDDLKYVDILSDDIADKTLSPNVEAIRRALKSKQFTL